jgi:hypothetical protein
LDLEKKVAKLVVALKKCQDEKKLPRKLLKILEKILKNFKKLMTRT